MISAKRIALKISGEALGSSTQTFDSDFIHRFVKSLIPSLDNHELVLIVGGGNLLRGKECKSLKMHQAKADQMGMLATMMNGIFLKEVFEQCGQKASLLSNIFCPNICDVFTIDRANDLLKKGHIVICTGGTSSPYFTTDTAVVVKACELKCDLIMKATKVKGVFSKDPLIHEDAKFFKRLNFEEALALNLKVMDRTAFEMAQSQNIPIIVFSLTESMHNVLEDKCDYTIVVNQN